jgi:hypothetical protein
VSNVKALPGFSAPTCEPDERLVKILEELLAMAKSGQLRSFIGTGFVGEGLRVATWADFHDDVYQMLGALAWLQAEYTHRHTEG